VELSPVVRDPCASERKIGVVSGDRRIARSTISLGLFKLVLQRALRPEDIPPERYRVRQLRVDSEPPWGRISNPLSMTSRGLALVAEN
jgi:hypothetical protein